MPREYHFKYSQMNKVDIENYNLGAFIVDSCMKKVV